MPSDIKTIYGPINAASQDAGSLSYSNGIITVIVRGTFVGSLEVMGQSNISPLGFAPATPVGHSSASITAPGVYFFPRFSGDFRWKVFSSSWTSGTADVVLSAAPGL